MVLVDDTALAVTDTGGPGIGVVYLKGQFATQGYWRRVIAERGPGWRHMAYDERARGKKSKPSADYSLSANWAPVLDNITVPVCYVVASGPPSEAAVMSRNGYAPTSMR